MTMCKKDGKPPHQRSRSFIASKGVGFIFRHLTLEKRQNVITEYMLLLDLLYYRCNSLIMTVVDGGIFERIFKTYYLREKC